MKLTPITAFFLDMFIITGFRPMSNVFGLILNVITTKERVTGVITTLHVEKERADNYLPPISTNVYSTLYTQPFTIQKENYHASSEYHIN